MDKITINSNNFEIKECCLENICSDFKKRIIKILYLKEDVESGRIKDYDMISYIETLTWDIFGTYKLYAKYRFVSCISELEGLKENINQTNARKKILDIANFIEKIPYME